ncbi:WXG100 family type VII secretion target [Antrihabitans cavernicola]|uniref:ESAT-6-like protein n=1 Tax=Antrihabitans cavernicola TaxID=2495913 RepID=A0A5A7S9A2_9NOCA|nr:WXG100 family type VII secretion target [Spelaeibacter cavernicola]KAA0021487.1 WXG100 family type VII secretion target [Spelaeibacter cavernicola]
MSMTYNFASISALADALNGQSSQISARHDELQNYVNGLKASWDGNAQNAFADVQRRWDEAQFEMNDVLRQISATARNAGEDMHNTENRAASSW